MKKLFVFIIILLFSIPFYAQDTIFVTGEERLNEWKKHQEMTEKSLFRNLQWKQIGPLMNSGRISSIVGIPGNPSIIYTGTPVGGVWKTENAGNTWFPVFDEQPTQMIGDIEVFPDNPDLVWVGTGSSNLSGSAFPGLGVFKSEDGGLTWKHKGLEEGQNIMRIAISSHDPNTVYVAAMGNKYYPEDETIGLFKTTDGGDSWIKVLSDDRYTGCADVAINPENPEIVFATTWNKKETIGNVHRSTDGGKSWSKLYNGLPQGENIGRIGIYISPSDPDIVYAYMNNHNDFYEEYPGLLETEVKETCKGIELGNVRKMSTRRFLKLDSVTIADFLEEYGIIRYFSVNKIREMIETGQHDPVSLADCIEKYWVSDDERTKKIAGEVYRSDDGGNTWYKTHKEPLYLLSSFGWSFCDVVVSPVNKDEIYILGVTLQHSTDGGETFEHIEGNLVHIQPNISKYLHLDQHDLWIDPENPDRILLGNDGGTFITHDKGENWMHHNTIPIGMFYKIAVDMEEPYNIYGGTQDDSHVYGPSTQDISYNVTDKWEYVWLDRWSGGDGLHIMPYIDNPDIIYYSSQNGALRRKIMSENKNTFVRPERSFCEPELRHDWSTPFYVSPDEKNTIYYSANRLFKSTDRGDTWQAISPDLTLKEDESEKQNDKLTSFAVCENDPDLICTGSGRGELYITRNGGDTWKHISKDLPAIRVNSIDISAFDRSTVYIALSPNDADRNPYLYRSNDYGEIWKSINGNLPIEKTRCITEDPVRKGLLYAGTELGVYASLDDGVNWYSLNTGLPAVSVDDLLVHPRENELVIGTYGRGIYKMDISPLQNLNDTVLESDLHLFVINESRLPQQRDYHDDWYFETAKYPKFTFFTKTGGEVKLEIINEKGKIIKTITKDAVRGINEIKWDLVKTPARYVTSAYKTGTELYPPGSYTVRISKGEKRIVRSFMLKEHRVTGNEK
ncbi:MAG: hypothetical protein U9N72_12720 [Bacteroidota bacterium]|nr:hypothetical protein [Bacteroidota bacterium]